MLSVLSTALLAAVAAVAALPAASPPVLEYGIASAEKASAGVNSYSITLTITNKGNTTAKLLNDPRGTLSKLPTNAFKITHDESGKSPEFWGALVKFNPEYAVKHGEDDAFVSIEPGKSFKVTHNLAEAYDFASVGKGTYTVEPSPQFASVDGSGALLDVKVPSQMSKITMDGPIDAARSSEPSLSARASYNKCSTARVNAIKQAIPAARSYALSAYNKLGGNSQRFRTWFGTYSNANRIQVRNHYAKIYNTGFNNFNYDCTCTASGTYAYVYPDRPTRIYLCGAFWKAPVRGTDSKAGTFVHESSHFNKHGATQDYAYGQSAAKALARSNPARARQNADSHEYFAENNPSISKEAVPEGDLPYEEE